MKLDHQKELTPVLYGDSAVKIIDHVDEPAGRYVFGMHWHDRMEILLIKKGSLKIGCSEGSLEAEAGSLAIFCPETPHSGIAGSRGVTYHAIMFDLARFYNQTGISGKLLSPIADQQTVFSTLTRDPEAIACAEEIIAAQRGGSEADSLAAVAGVYRLLAALYRSCPHTTRAAYTDSGKFKEITEYINGHFCEDISSAGLSRKFGYDEAYFCRRFKKVTGLSPMVYIRILRLEKARGLLKSGSLTLTEVADLCSFSDMAYFSRSFKKHYGITPGVYAEKYRR
ncbi:MAG: helix-turn-helix transcriptional regulator [Clostridia bacterium]|nr:helix-turn-helix transcriptional regulator [Clostridia bacterium]